MNTPTTFPATAATEAGASFGEALHMDRDTGAGGMVARNSAHEPFRVVMADPPWNFRLYSNKGTTRAPQRHYDCLKLADIKALPVSDVAAKSSILFLWATNPMLPHALEVINAWGWEYCTKIEWVKMTLDNSKPRLGTGYRVRSSTEPLLIATRGNDLFCPGGAIRLPGVILAPRGRHSEKPADQWPYMEQYPGPYLELFARETHPGWTCLGNEIDGRDIRESLADMVTRISPQMDLGMDPVPQVKRNRGGASPVNDSRIHTMDQEAA